MVTQEQRKARLQELGDEFLLVFGSLELTDYILDLGAKYQVGDRSHFNVLIGDTLLGFYDRDNLPEIFATELEVAKENIPALVSDISKIYTLIDSPDAIQKLAMMTGAPTPPPETQSPISNDAPSQTYTPTSLRKPKQSLGVATPVEPAPVPPKPEPEPTLTSAPAAEPAPAPTPIPSYKKPLTDVPRYDTPAADPYKMQPEGEESGESESEGGSGTENGGGNTAQRW